MQQPTPIRDFLHLPLSIDLIFNAWCLIPALDQASGIPYCIDGAFSD